jgi:hypothetical protein
MKDAHWRSMMAKAKFDWEAVNEQEIQRLAKCLYTHLRRMGVKLEKPKRLQHVRDLLKRQHGTCALGDGISLYCWNAPKDRELRYLKLEWGHKDPRLTGTTVDSLENLYLVCARCNNQLQTSRRLEDMVIELEHKVTVMRRLLIKKSGRTANTTAEQSS